MIATALAKLIETIILYLMLAAVAFVLYQAVPRMVEGLQHKVEVKQYKVTL